MKLLTFLGTGNYSETAYTWNGQMHLAKYAPIATAKIVNITSITVFLTEEVHQKIYPNFEQSVPTNIKVNPIPVDLGKNEIELWKIFDVISRSVNSDEKIVFDITHGLRSFPLLGLLVAAFLRASQKVNIQHVFYGAYDVRDQSSTPHRTPIFDLTPMLALLDWTNATNRFVKTGDARNLADLMEQVADGNTDVSSAAQSVQDVSMAAFLCQPLPLAQKSKDLINSLEKAKDSLQAKVPPFELLRKRITDDFSPFVHEKDDFKGLLQAQLNLIKWYHKNNQLIQAMTLVREWLINAVTFKLELPFSSQHQIREEQIARAISGLSLLKSKSNITDATTKEKRRFLISDLNDQGYEIYTKWDAILWRKLVNVWFKSVNDVRNTLNHAGYQAQPKSIEGIVKCANETMPMLDELAYDFGIQP